MLSSLGFEEPVLVLSTNIISKEISQASDRSLVRFEQNILLAKVNQHQRNAQDAFDLVASNSYCSAEVRQIMGSALMNSYCIGLPGNRFYGGCFDIDDIENRTRELLCEVYQAKYCEVQLLSGMLANIAAYNATLPHRGLTVMASPPKNGGHYSHNAGGALTRFFGAKIVTTPWDPHTYNVKINALPAAMKKHKPSLLIIGWSEMLFEHDLPAIKKICKRHECKLLYDMSHVAGLVAGGVFQRDLMKYADIVTSSTGKSLHSADHGIVLYNDPSFTPKIREAVLPILTSNTHFHETAALCMTLLEMKEFGAKYAQQVVANTRALAKQMALRNFKILCEKQGYSASHVIIVDLESASGAEATELLDKAGIFVNPQELPKDTEKSGATALRLGTQVLTRRGYKESDMTAVAAALEDVLIKREKPTIVAKSVARKCSGFQGVAFSFSNGPISSLSTDPIPSA
ncbi:hypothetical protein ACA910_017973 [Epithemia clementina (nom. ined.)]